MGFKGYNGKIIVMTVYSTKETLKQRFHQMRSIIGKYGEKGMLEAFNNAIGFHNVIDTVRDDKYVAKKVEGPKEYKAPYYQLLDGCTFLDKPNEIVTFVVPIKKHFYTNKKYSYDTLEMMLKLQQFLYRQMKGIHIEICMVSKFHQSLKEWALGRFLCLLAEGEHIDVEFSSHRLLKKKEVDYIVGKINSVTTYTTFYLNQYECETCKFYDRTHPFHIELLPVRN